jgi:hypothetical protein
MQREYWYKKYCRNKDQCVLEDFLERADGYGNKIYVQIKNRVQ